MLHRVADHGGPAQSAQARRLLAELADDPDSAELQTAARALVEAYLHDPYLTR